MAHPQSVSADAVRDVLSILQLLITTSLALLSLAVALIEKIAGRESLRDWRLWLALILLAASIGLAFFSMGEAVTTAQTMGEVGKTLILDPRFPVSAHTSDAQASWRSLGRYGLVTLLVWCGGVSFLAWFTVRALLQRVRDKEGHAKWQRSWRGRRWSGWRGPAVRR